MFVIKCSECDTSTVLEDGFLKNTGNIAVYDAGKFIVSIKCNSCGHEIYSSEDD